MSPRNPSVELFLCLDCNINTRACGEYYMLKKEIWAAVASRWKGERPHMLCIGCVEERLGRRLVPSDFHPCPLNHISQIARFPKSNRLLNRLGKTLYERTTEAGK